MNCNDFKFYTEDGFDPRDHLETYYSDRPDMVFGDDSLVFPIENLKKLFSGGNLKGDVLIDLSCGSIIPQLYAVSEFYKCILALRIRYTDIMEMKRWLDTRTGAFGWRHATKICLGEDADSDQLQNKEEEIRSIMHHVVKCDLECENIMDPMVLPLADCIISAWLLEYVCKDQDDFKKSLKKFSKLLKPGGQFIYIGNLDATYAIIGEDKLKTFTYNEDFVRKALTEAGFVIDDCKVKKRTNMSVLTDYKAVICIAAHKEE
ncbi:indolethylamine N-methyltransferase-like [Dendropsophus ebraccatus]|uniref:indolethylamine N-methyltransferase-like n=1 Tax=Dendropsophus ebraccatus TaxID=150705 RepID=UPI003831B044